MTSDYKPTLIAEAVVAPIANGEVLVATVDNRKALVLNATGAVVVSLCDGQCSLEEISGLLAETQDIESARATADVVSLLQNLHTEGLLLNAPPA